jgi:hypothetical protein
MSWQPEKGERVIVVRYQAPGEKYHLVGHGIGLGLQEPPYDKAGLTKTERAQFVAWCDARNGEEGDPDPFMAAAVQLDSGDRVWGFEFNFFKESAGNLALVAAAGSELDEIPPEAERFRLMRESFLARAPRWSAWKAVQHFVKTGVALTSDDFKDPAPSPGAGPAPDPAVQN